MRIISDHFSVILTSNTVEECLTGGIFKRQTGCPSRLNASPFTDLLIQTVENTIHQTHFSKKCPKVPWFDKNCNKAIKERKKCRERCVFSNSTLSNVEKGQTLSCC